MRFPVHPRVAALTVGLAAFSAIALRSQTNPTALRHRFQEIKPGIYAAIGLPTPGRAVLDMNVGSNSAVIVNQDDVVVVDSHTTPESAQALLRDLKTITNKPVRFLIDTHFHFDHANGNQVFAPPIDIIGHEYTRRRLTGDDVLKRGMFANILGNLTTQGEDLARRAAAEKDPAAKAKLEQDVRTQRVFADSMRATRPTPPTLTLQDRMTIVRGGREIQILHLGRAHTAGDVVVYLPQERIVCTGDAVYGYPEYPVPSIADGYVNEWPDTLERLMALDFVDVIPGHGEPLQGKDLFRTVQAYMRELWRQTKAFHDQGVPPDQAASRIDMSAIKAQFPKMTTPNVSADGVRRMYGIMDGTAEP